MTPNRIVGACAGAVLGVLGLLGVGLSAGTGIAPGAGGLLLGALSVGWPLAALHLVLAAALVLGALRTDRAARRLNTAAGTALLLLGMFGLFAVGTPANVLALGGADNLLHFAASATLLATGLGARRAREPGSAARSR